MALTELIFGAPTKAEVGFVQFDCSVSERHTDEAEITEHPVEFGSDVSDHIRKLPKSIEINGIVTNTPIVFLASLMAPSPVITDFLSKTDRVEAAYAELQRVMDDGELVDVVTSLKTYDNMAITSLVVDRDVATGNVLNCVVSLREVVIASTLTVDLPLPQNVANKAAKNKGAASKSAGSAAQGEQAQSALSQFVGSLFG